MTFLLNHRYRILQTLGDGGFGKTFLAEDTHLPSGRRCVVKQLKPVTHNPQVYQLIQARFQREAAILEALGTGSPQIPKLYAYFEEAGLFYLVQEWIDGITLTQWMTQQGLMPPEAVRALLINLLQVLEYVHSQGIIHRDIKPDNIMLRRSDQQPILIDFGAVKETVQTSLNTQSQPLRSIVIGTPGYMPSEQVMGKPVFSSDLYSLGLTAIYLLTGRSPLELETNPHTSQLLWQSYAPSLDSTLVAVLDRAIQPQAQDRYRTATELRNALQTAPPQATTILPASSTFPTTPPVSPNPAPTIPSIPPLTQVVVPSPVPGPISVQPLDHHRQNHSLIASSLIAGSLIGTSVIVGFILTRPTPSPSPGSTPIASASPSVQANTIPTTPATPASPIAISPESSPPSSPPLPDLPPPFPSVEASPPATIANEFAWLSTRPVTDADLAGKTAFELDLLRNAIYAMHGRQFKDEALQAYFNSRPWYKPLYSAETFPVRLLSNLERNNAQYILDYQDRNGLR